jgi:hypothetical protein
MSDRKPLELVVYPKVDRWVERRALIGTRTFRIQERGYELPTGVFEPDEVDLFFNKRLTDAELAAEYWNEQARAANALTGYAAASIVGDQEGEGAYSDKHDEHHRRLVIFRRFATHPHHDEEDQ